MSPSTRTACFARVTGANFCFFLTFASFFLLPLHVRALGGTERTIGLVMGTSGLAGLVSVLAVGALLDRCGRRIFLLAGLATMSAAAGAFLLVERIGSGIFVLRAVQGLAFAAGFNAASTLAAEFAPEGRRAAALGLFGVSTLATHALAPTLGEQLVRLGGFPALFVAATVFSAVGLAVAWPLPDEAPARARAAVPLRATAELSTAIATVACCGVAFGAVITYVPTFAPRSRSAPGWRRPRSVSSPWARAGAVPSARCPYPARDLRHHALGLLPRRQWPVRRRRGRDWRRAGRLRYTSAARVPAMAETTATTARLAGGAPSPRAGRAAVRRGAYYLLLTGAVGAAYLVAAVLFNVVFQARVVTDSRAFPVIFTLAVLVLFNPIRTRLQALVDRIFFRTRYDGAQVLAAVGAELAGTLKRERIVALVCDAVDAAIPNTGTRLLLGAPGEPGGLSGIPGPLLPQLERGQVLSTFDSGVQGGRGAGVAHEINNPVAFISSSVAPLRRRLETAAADAPPEVAKLLANAREIVAVMARGAERTAAIVKDLRSFSRLGEATRKRVDLHVGLEVSLRLLEPRWRDRIEIHRDYGTLSPVECDPGQVNQVFMNLLANACDAIPERGNVWITTRAAGEQVRVTIRDDGVGMTPEMAGRIFDPFFTTKDVGGGTGLGLAISHGVVAAHGGRIEVESAPGKGATFRVSLPLAPPAASLDRTASGAG